MPSLQTLLVRLRCSPLRRYALLLVPLTLVITIALVFAVRWLRYQQSCSAAAPIHWGEMNYGHCFKEHFEELRHSK